MVSERQRTNIVAKQINKSYIPDNQKHTKKKHIFIEELLSVYHFHKMWK